MADIEEDNIRTEKVSKPKGGVIKRIFKVILYIILSVVALNVLIYVLLSIPAVQQRVVEFVVARIQPKINTEVSIEKVRISLFDKVNLQGVYIESQQRDTLLYAGDLDVKLNIWGLLRNNLTINSIKLDNAFVNVSQAAPDAPFNFQFLIDAFASDSTQQDTTSSALVIHLNDIRISNSRISYNVLSEPQTPGVFNVSHINTKKLNAHIQLPSIDIAHLKADIVNFSLEEESGLKIENLEVVLRSKLGELWTENCKLTLPNSSLSLDSVNYNPVTNAFRVKLDGSLSPLDGKIFMPGLGELDELVSLKANVSGKLPEIVVNIFEADYGNELIIRANGFISDYEHYTKSPLRLQISEFKATPKAVVQFARIGDPEFTAPDILKTLGVVGLDALAEGTLENLKLDADVWVNQGSAQLRSHISIKDSAFQNFTVDASLSSYNFNVGSFFDKSLNIKRMTLHSGVNLTSVHSKINAKLIGTIDQFQRDTVTIKNVRFGGTYNPVNISAWINAPLNIGALRADASVSQGNYNKAKFDIDVKDFKIDRFYENPAWINPRLSLCLTGDLQFSTIDDISGVVVLDSLILNTDGFRYEPGRIRLTSSQEKENKFVKLDSPFLNAKIDGEYKITTLPGEFTNFMSAYLPGRFKYDKRIRRYENDFNISAEIYNSEDLGRIFELPIDVIRPIKAKGRVSTIHREVKIDVDIPLLRFGANDITQSVVNIYNTESKFNIDLNSHLVTEGDKFMFKLVNSIEADTIETSLYADNGDAELKIGGELSFLSHFEKNTKGEDVLSYIQFKPTDILVGDLRLLFLPGRIETDGKRTVISDFGLNVGMGRMMSRYFAVDGAISDQKQDTLNVRFENARIGDILRPFNINNISATIDGTMNFTNIVDKPAFYTRNLQVSDIIVFGDTLGTLKVSSRWNNERKAIGVRATLAHNEASSKIHGLIFLNEERMKMNIDLEKFSLKWLHPFMSDVLSSVNGSISSRIALDGSLDKPTADGWLGFNDASVGVGLTNVTYSISDTIKVFKDRVGFRDLEIKDNEGHKATMSALLNYEDLSNPNFLMKMQLNNFLVLNTETRTDSLFYGKLRASGDIRIRGNMDDIKVDMNIQNDKKSALNITIPETSEASEYKNIVFINVPNQDSTITSKPPQPTPLPINLNMNLTVNQGINLAVFMNSSNPLDMQMKGAGLIDFSYDMLKNRMQAFGAYSINDGVVKIRIQNLKTLAFNIQQGSTLTFIGDPMNTNFDITAYYKVNASLYGLDNSFSRTRIPVHCVLGMKGNLNKMDLTYSITLPDASDDIKQKVQSLISTDEQKTIQFGNLILFSSFKSLTGDDGSGNVLGSLVSSTLSGALSSLFGSILGDKWQIGANVETADGSFSDANVTVNASTQFLDDRLTVSTNIGYRNDQSSSVNDNSFIGDFDVAYQLSNAVKLRAYTHTNDKFYKQAATTQGVGIVYTKEASTLKKLFGFFSNRKKNKLAEETVEDKKE